MLIVFDNTVESRMAHTMCTRDLNYVAMTWSTLAQMVGIVESLFQGSTDKMETAGERVNIAYPEALACVNLLCHLSSSDLEV